MSMYLVHSAKGTSWGDHKYYKKENGKYFYSEAAYLKYKNQFTDIEKQQMAASGKGDLIKYGRQTSDSSKKEGDKKTIATPTVSTNKSNTKKSSSKKKSDSKKTSTKKSSSSSKKSSSTSKKSSGDEKEKSSSSKSSGASTKEKNTEAKVATQEVTPKVTKTAEKTTVEKQVVQNEQPKQMANPKVAIKEAVNKAMKLGEDDSLYFRVTDNNQWEALVVMADGTRKTMIYDENFNLVSSNEEKKDEVKHSDEYLEHHGIAGQKWGKRNGPPYPLDYESHSSKEKKSNPKSKIDGNSEKSGSKHKGLSDKQKKILKTVGIATGVGLAAGIGGYALYKTGALDSLIKVGKDAVNKIDFNKELDDRWKSIMEEADSDEYDLFGDLKSDKMFGNVADENNGSAITDETKSLAEELHLKTFDKIPSPDEIMKNVNPNGDTTINTCMLSGLFTELQNRGIDISVEKGTTTNGFKPEIFEKCFKNTKVEPGPGVLIDGWEDLDAYMVNKFGNDSRGSMMLKFSDTFKNIAKLTGEDIPDGHNISWRIDDNKLKLFDNDNGYMDGAKSSTVSEIKDFLENNFDLDTMQYVKLNDKAIDVDGLQSVLDSLKDMKYS